MDTYTTQIEAKVYSHCSLEISDFKAEAESQEYDACRFKLNGLNVISRSAKITPKKVGQFVTFWKRNESGPIEPFAESNPIDFFVVNVRSDRAFGQFVFPKSVLIQKGIISTNRKEGKRAFRVYPSWDKAQSKQAERTQKWQLDFFYTINDSTDLDKVANLFRNA